MKKQSTICHPVVYDMGVCYVASGSVIDDPRFEDNCRVRTSMIEKIDFVNNTIETHNTVYNVIGDIRIHE